MCYAVAMAANHEISTADELWRTYRPVGKASLDKEVTHLDAHCRDYIAHSPFVVLATTDGRGRVDTSPKGGPPGFVAVLDDHRCAIPDMAGNNRLDSLQNILCCPSVSLLFLVPGVGETLRVVGAASISADPAVLEHARVAGLRPNVAVVVEVVTAYLHCAKALRRSGLWSPESWPDTADMASPACMMRDHMRLVESTEEMQAFLDRAYAETTWAVGGQAEP